MSKRQTRQSSKTERSVLQEKCSNIPSNRAAKQAPRYSLGGATTTISSPKLSPLKPQKSLSSFAIHADESDAENYPPSLPASPHSVSKVRPSRKNILKSQKAVLPVKFSDDTLSTDGSGSSDVPTRNHHARQLKRMDPDDRLDRILLAATAKKSKKRKH